MSTYTIDEMSIFLTEGFFRLNRIISSNDAVSIIIDTYFILFILTSEITTILATNI